MPDLTPPSLLEAAGMLTAAPPSVEHATRLLSNTRDYDWFRDTVRELMPEDAEEILGRPGHGEKIEAFAESFESRYFPLCGMVVRHLVEEMKLEATESVYTILRMGIPGEPVGIDPENVHEMWSSYRNGISAIALLPRIEDDPGIRTAWLEEAQDHIPRETLMRIPRDGIPRDEIEKAVAGTNLEGAAQVFEWLFSDSGNPFVDSSCTDTQEQSGLTWDRETTEELKKMWDEAEPIMRAIREVCEWVEEDLPARFSEMLDLILRRTGTTEAEGKR